MRADDMRFLLNPPVLGVLERLQDLSADALQLSRSPLLKPYSSGRRRLVVEQIHLRKRAAKKFSRAKEMLFTKTGLEQATREEIARYKCNKMRSFTAEAVDLCCGLGGDSLGFDGEVTGVDWDEAALLGYRWNRSLEGRKTTVVCGDVSVTDLKAPAYFIDPSRRQGRGEKRWGSSGLSPSLSFLEATLPRWENVALKLGPGFPLPDFLLEHEVEYLGWGDECLEACVWTGGLGKAGYIRVTEVRSGKSIGASRGDVEDSFGRVEPPGQYLFEPVKALIRSHLFGILAQQLGLWQIDGRTAYLSGNEPLKHPLLKGYRLLEELPLNPKKIRRHLFEGDFATPEVKKRGVSIIPEVLAGQLQSRGGRACVVIATRCAGRKKAFLGEPI